MMASKTEHWRARANNLLQHPVVAGIVVGVILLGITSAVTEAAWNVPTDVLQQEVRVWQALLGAAAIFGAAGGAVVWFRRQQVPTPKSPVWASCPTEINHFGVLWPITTVHDGIKPTGFKAGQPVCPKDRTPLAMLMKLDEGTAEEEKVVVPMSKMWKSFDVSGMRFECSKCGAEYDLRSFRYGAPAATELVEDHAWGEYNTALAKAEAKRGP